MVKIAKEKYELKIVNQVLDTIHGHIALTKVEDEIEKLPIFKRLLNISQLGLVNRIFPGAVHNRYSHSLGVMYVSDLMLLSINNGHQGNFFTTTERQILRLAGLLHDIGHYPLSHNIEAAYRSCEKIETIENNPIERKVKEITSCPKELVEKKVKPFVNYIDNYMGTKLKARYHHERIGHDIITHNGDIHKCIRENFILINGNLNRDFIDVGKNSYTDKEIDTITDRVLEIIANIVVGNYECNAKYCPHYTAMVQLIHSELDADKIDYLLRDATFAGTTYGIMDFNLLVKQLDVATIECHEKGNVEYKYVVGIKSKGIGNVEQFLMNRYLSYKQVVHSKYVSILEAMAYNIARTFVRSDRSEYYYKKIEKYCESKETEPAFLSFTDNYVLSFFNTQIDENSPNKEILKYLKEYRAFNLVKEHNNQKESICTDIKNIDCINMMKRDKLFEEFLKCFDKVKSKQYKDLTTDERKELFSYRFESFSLTEQIPLTTFKGIRDTNYIKYDFFRLANGIPIIEESEYMHMGGPDDIDSLPQLVIDYNSSFLHNIHELRYYILRKYEID